MEKVIQNFSKLLNIISSMKDQINIPEKKILKDENQINKTKVIQLQIKIFFYLNYAIKNLKKYFEFLYSEYNFLNKKLKTINSLDENKINILNDKLNILNNILLNISKEKFNNDILELFYSTKEAIFIKNKKDLNRFIEYINDSYKLYNKLMFFHFMFLIFYFNLKYFKKILS